MNIELQLSTRVLLRMGMFFQDYGVTFAIGVVVAIIAFLAFIRVKIFRPVWHRCLLCVPYISSIQKRSAISQMGRTMGLLLHSGVPIRDAIEATASVFSNRVYSKVFIEAKPLIETGVPLSDAMEQHPKLFPKMAVALVRIGEETGSLSESMEYLSGMYDEKVDYSIKDFTTVLEPLLLMFIGGIVGLVVYSIVVPVYQITSTIQ